MACSPAVFLRFNFGFVIFLDALPAVERVLFDDFLNKNTVFRPSVLAVFFVTKMQNIFTIPLPFDDGFLYNKNGLLSWWSYIQQKKNQTSTKDKEDIEL